LRFKETIIIDKNRITEGFWCFTSTHYQKY
jgi:hypothetical protein